MTDGILDGVHDDAGLQPERTTLAWVRTSALAAVVSVLYVRAVPGPLVLVAIIAALCGTPAAVILSTSGRTHIARVRSMKDGSTEMQWKRGLWLCAGMLGLAGSTTVLILLAPS